MNEERTPRDLTLIADVVRQPGGTMVAADSTLVLEPLAGSALFAFESPGPAACVEWASLRVRALSGVADVPRFEAWVSIETEVADLPDGASLGATVVHRGSPPVDATITENLVSWDVTALIAWAQEHQPDSKTFVVAVKPGFRPPELPVVLPAMEGGESAKLTVVESPHC